MSSPSNSVSTDSSNVNTSTSKPNEADQQDDEPVKRPQLNTPPKPTLKSTEKCRKLACTPELPKFQSGVYRELNFRHKKQAD